MPKTAAWDIARLWLKRAFYGVFALLLIFLACLSALRTAHIEQNELHDDVVAFAADSIWPHLLFLPLLGLCVWLLRGRLAKWEPNKLAFAVTLWVLALGLCWVSLAMIIPRADQQTVAVAAAAFSKGDFDGLRETGHRYFRFYPFQLGFTLWLEQGFRILNPLLRLLGVPGESHYFVTLMFYQVFNVLFLCGLCLLLLWWLKLALPQRQEQEDRMPQNLLLLMLAGFAPAILYCTFVYGVLPGMFFSVLAAAFQMKFIRTGRARWAFLAAGSIALACALKPNSMIVLAALCIQLFLYFLKRRHWLRLVMVPVSVACVLLASALPQMIYESRSGTELGQGIPRTAWLAMGLADSSQLGPGWWDPQYTINLYYETGGDPAAMETATRATLRRQLKVMAENPAKTLRFFMQKAESQWCEPTYESIWISAACRHGTHSANRLAQYVYGGAPGRLLEGWMNLGQTALYLLAALGALFQLRRPKTAMITLPMAVLGGFLYHQLFEGKSQYIFPYAMLLLPLAAYGLWRAVSIFRAKGGEAR